MCLGEVVLSLALANSRAISLFLADSQATPWVDALHHAKAPWRQAKVCLRPLSSYGEDRASRPPPLQHRVPHTSRGLLDFSRCPPTSATPDHSGTFSVTGRAVLGTGADA